MAFFTFLLPFSFSPTTMMAATTGITIFFLLIFYNIHQGQPQKIGGLTDDSSNIGARNQACQVKN
jgi:hypothetical protein